MTSRRRIARLPETRYPHATASGPSLWSLPRPQQFGALPPPQPAATSSGWLCVPFLYICSSVPHPAGPRGASMFVCGSPTAVAHRFSPHCSQTTSTHLAKLVPVSSSWIGVVGLTFTSTTTTQPTHLFQGVPMPVIHHRVGLLGCDPWTCHCHVAWFCNDGHRVYTPNSMKIHKIGRAHV